MTVNLNKSTLAAAIVHAAFEPRTNGEIMEDTRLMLEAKRKEGGQLHALREAAMAQLAAVHAYADLLQAFGGTNDPEAILRLGNAMRAWLASGVDPKEITNADVHFLLNAFRGI